jgi:hypothetical protein
MLQECTMVVVLLTMVATEAHLCCCHTASHDNDDNYNGESKSNNSNTEDMSVLPLRTSAVAL